VVFLDFVANGEQMMACLLGTASVCMIQADTIIYLPNSATIARNLQIAGYSNSVIDLMGSRTFVDG
jgi:hypothetical protein